MEALLNEHTCCTGCFTVQIPSTERSQRLLAACMWAVYRGALADTIHMHPHGSCDLLPSYSYMCALLYVQALDMR